MPRILILSSFVAIGHVGLSAGQPVCQMLGINVTAVPTTVLSNHPGWPKFSQIAFQAQDIEAFAEALGSNGLLADHSAILIGYMPSVAHVDCAAAWAARLRRVSSGTRIVVDPILGDHPKGLYMPENVAAAVRDKLLPLTDVLTPNHFELEWLSGGKCATLSDTKSAARELGVAEVNVTSPPLGSGQTGVLSLDGDQAYTYTSPKYENVPHGVGDVFAAMIAANLSVGQAVGHVHAIAFASQGKKHLEIVNAAPEWLSAKPIAPAELD